MSVTGRKVQVTSEDVRESLDRLGDRSHVKKVTYHKLRLLLPRSLHSSCAV